MIDPVNAILDGSAPAKLVLVHDSLGAPSGPVVHELVARALERYVSSRVATS
jgi:hypothetical protein